MKYILVILLVLFGFNKINAQEKHFIFIQSDNKQIFNVTLNGKVYSSTASGYVIIPKLLDGEYTFSIGFADNTIPEPVFRCVVNKKDLGFELKNLPEKGWTLFNLQTMDVITAGLATPAEVIKAAPVAATEEEEPISFNKKKDTATAVATKSSVDTSLQSSEAQTPSAPSIPSVKEVAATNNKDTVAVDIKKVSEVKETGGVTISYTDAGSKSTDTIQVVIPSTPPQSHEEKPAIAVAAAPAKTDDVKFLDIEMNGTKKDSLASSADKETASVSTSNTGCSSIATDEDYAKLRRRMAMESTDEKMIREARKLYRSKCFTTRQIKGLSTLFMSDEGRYNFFTVSYSFVADAAEYKNLQTEFVDPTYLNRFKSLLQ